MSDGIRAMWMRGGTSKGGYFLADDLPPDPADRDRLLLRIMGSPDARQIDGLGSADPLTSKAALVRRSERPGVDVDYLFLQVFVDRPLVSTSQNCGNILAGVAPFAIERDLVDACADTTSVRIYMENSGQVATASVATPGMQVSYRGDARLDGVPGSAAPVAIEFEDTGGASCGSLLPTGNLTDMIEGTELTMIDNGMPCVVLRARDAGISGSETPADLDANSELRARLETIRRICGPMMHLGDVSADSVPKMVLVSPPRHGGTVTTRTFIPHRCHKTVGVFGALSVATACLLPAGPAASAAEQGRGRRRELAIEHPGGALRISARLDDDNSLVSAAVVNTARKLFDGRVFAE